MRRSLLFAVCRARGGNVAIEMALVLPAFLALVFGTIEYGRLLWTRQALQETATVAARCMAILQSPCASGGSYSAIRTTSYIQQVGNQWGLSVPSSAITLMPNATCGGVAGFSEVSLAFRFISAVPKIVLLPAGGFVLSTAACYPNNP